MTLHEGYALEQHTAAQPSRDDRFEIASLLLSRMTVPVVYFLVKRRELRRAARIGQLG